MSLPGRVTLIDFTEHYPPLQRCRVVKTGSRELFSPVCGTKERVSEVVPAPQEHTNTHHPLLNPHLYVRPSGEGWVKVEEGSGVYP